MKAVIVKNDEFETIGFEVTENSHRIFNWGIAAQPTNFKKEIDTEEHFDSIMELIRLEARISERDRFFSEMVEVLELSKFNPNGFKFNTQGHEVKTQLLREKITKIIYKIK